MSVGTLVGVWMASNGYFGPDPHTSTMVGAMVGNQIDPMVRNMASTVIEVGKRVVPKLMCCCWDRKSGSRVVIRKDDNNPIFVNLERFIVRKHIDLLRECELRPFNGEIAFSLKDSRFRKPLVDEFEDHVIQLSLGEEEQKVASSGGSAEDQRERSIKETMVTIESPTASIEALRRYVDMVAQFRLDARIMKVYRGCVDRGKDNAANLYWKEREVITVKNLDNTIVSDNVRKNVFDDVEHFMESEREYARQGIPWNRGYLLYGEPGTGKTSTIKSIANHYGMPIFTVSMDIFADDNEFVRLMSDISLYTAHKPYILALEDLDRAKMFEDRYRNNVSLTSVLNELDGVTECHGRVLFMTTNNRERLEQFPALLRAGRVDQIVEVTYCTPEQMRRLVAMVLMVDLERVVLPPASEAQVKMKMSPAAVIQVVQGLMYEHERSVDRVLEAVRDQCFRRRCISVTRENEEAKQGRVVLTKSRNARRWHNRRVKKARDEVRHQKKWITNIEKNYANLDKEREKLEKNEALLEKKIEMRNKFNKREREKAKKERAKAKKQKTTTQVKDFQEPEEPLPELEAPVSSSEEDNDYIPPVKRRRVPARRAKMR